MQLSELTSAECRNLLKQVHYMVMTFDPHEAARISGYWNWRFMLRFLVWCESAMATDPRTALPYALAAPEFAQNWANCEPAKQKAWARYYVRSYAVRATALRIQGDFRGADIAYRHGDHLLMLHSVVISSQDISEYYRRAAKLWLYQGLFEKAEADARFAQQAALALRRADRARCHASLGEVYLYASIEQDDECLKGSVAKNREEAGYHLNEAIRLLDARVDPIILEAAVLNLAGLSAQALEETQRLSLLQRINDTRSQISKRRQKITIAVNKFDWMRALAHISVGDLKQGRRILWNCKKRFDKFGMLDHAVAVLLDLAALEAETGNLVALRKHVEDVVPLIGQFDDVRRREASALRKWCRDCLEQNDPDREALCSLRSSLGLLPAIDFRTVDQVKKLA
ncbi:MAG: hypothetical protein AAF968_00225 [Pseudomonadota bacterium]